MLFRTEIPVIISLTDSRSSLGISTALVESNFSIIEATLIVSRLEATNRIRSTLYGIYINENNRYLIHHKIILYSDLKVQARDLHIHTCISIAVAHVLMVGRSVSTL